MDARSVHTPFQNAGVTAPCTVSATGDISVVVPLAEASVAPDWPACLLRDGAAMEVLVAATAAVPDELVARLTRDGCIVSRSDGPRGQRLSEAAAAGVRWFHNNEPSGPCSRCAGPSRQLQFFAPPSPSPLEPTVTVGTKYGASVRRIKEIRRPTWPAAAVPM